MDRPLIRILIADGYPVVRSGLKRFVGSEPGLEVCGEAGTGQGAILLATQLRPDVVVLDPHIGDMPGPVVLSRLRAGSPDTLGLVFLPPGEHGEVRELVLAGARGCVLKSDQAEIVVSAVRALASGRTFFSPSLTEPDLLGFLQLLPDPIAGTVDGPLTPRQLQVMRHLAEGLGNKEVASLLGISVKTVETHRAAIMRKIGAHSTVDLVRHAIRNNLTPL
jgi:DNA-binding NarL/FixJ family response regulator